MMKKMGKGGMAGMMQALGGMGGGAMPGMPKMPGGMMPKGGGMGAMPNPADMTPEQIAELKKQLPAGLGKLPGLGGLGGGGSKLPGLGGGLPGLGNPFSKKK